MEFLLIYTSDETVTTEKLPTHMDFKEFKHIFKIDEGVISEYNLYQQSWDEVKKEL